jgi:hypothetical protein
MGAKALGKGFYSSFPGNAYEPQPSFTEYGQSDGDTPGFVSVHRLQWQVQLISSERCAAICRRFHRSTHKCRHRGPARPTGCGLRTEVLFGRRFCRFQNQCGESASRQGRLPTGRPASEETHGPCRTPILMVQYTASRPLRGPRPGQGCGLRIYVVRNTRHCRSLSAIRNSALCARFSSSPPLAPCSVAQTDEIGDAVPFPECCGGRMSRCRDRSPDHRHQQRDCLQEACRSHPYEEVFPRWEDRSCAFSRIRRPSSCNGGFPPSPMDMSKVPSSSQSRRDPKCCPPCFAWATWNNVLTSVSSVRLSLMRPRASTVLLACRRPSL